MVFVLHIQFNMFARVKNNQWNRVLYSSYVFNPHCAAQWQYFTIYYIIYDIWRGCGAIDVKFSSIAHTTYRFSISWIFGHTSIIKSRVFIPCKRKTQFDRKILYYLTVIFLINMCVDENTFFYIIYIVYKIN